jgi:DNA repair exonuclease SbcCD ATPase subunit
VDLEHEGETAAERLVPDLMRCLERLTDSGRPPELAAATAGAWNAIQTVLLERAAAGQDEAQAEVALTIQELEDSAIEDGGWIHELEADKAWLESQWNDWRRTAEDRARQIQDLQTWISELEQADAWHDAQSRKWQQLAAERDQKIAEQREWIESLEEAKAWLDSQRRTWRTLAQEREQLIDQLQARLAELEAATQAASHATSPASDSAAGDSSS